MLIDENTGRTPGSPPREPGRALVVFERRRKARTLARPQADFVTQLIACEHRIGAYRRSRLNEAGLHVPAYGPSGPDEHVPTLDRRV